MYSLGILGLGKMGGSILEGVTNAKIFNNDDIMFYTLGEEEQKKYQNLGYVLAKNEKDLFENCKTILLAIKPQMFAEALENAKDIDFNGRCVITIAAGIAISYVENYFSNATVVRVMPNTPALIKMAAATICTNNKNELYEQAKTIFSSIGSVTEIEESQMNDSLPLNGSMPAYLYLFAKAFIESAKKYNIDEEAAKVLCCNAIIGSANMILQSSDSIDTLINNVCSKGGTTIEGLNELYENNFIEAVDKCYDACVRRAYELNK